MENVIALIMPDENLKNPNRAWKNVSDQRDYQSLGKVAFTQSGRLLAGSSAAGTGAYSGFRTAPIPPRQTAFKSDK